MNQLTVIVTGPQGSGKDTQVDLLKQYLEKNDPSRPTVHFDAGTALRAFAAKSGYTQDRAKEILDRGELLPMFVLADVMSEFFIENLHGNEHLLVSGFPRSGDQLRLFNSAMEFYKRDKPTLLMLHIPEEESVRRLLQRGRSDDTEEGIRKRLQWTHSKTMPVIEELKANPLYRYAEVSGVPAIEDVHAEVLKALKLS